MAAERLPPADGTTSIVGNGGSSGGLHPPPPLGNPTSRQIASAIGSIGKGIRISSANPGVASTVHGSVATTTAATTASGDPCMSWTNLESMGAHQSMGGEGGTVPLTLEEMEMDFAKLFDPNVEWENMQTEGSGWPQMLGTTAEGTGGAVTMEVGTAGVVTMGAGHDGVNGGESGASAAEAVRSDESGKAG
mmetsp:Transcript_28045/g.51248  ORF Transcript_28045/g.51248 Transcript_28045/m.51248 type:complete len:191 (+) Transcript_28045:2-574(+)